MQNIETTVVFWPKGARFSDDKQWSYHRPELSDGDAAKAAAKGQQGTAWVYRGIRCVNTFRDKISAEIEF